MADSAPRVKGAARVRLSIGRSDTAVVPNHSEHLSSMKSSAGFLLGAVLLGGLLWANHERTASCTVGVSGFDAMVTISGWGAPRACRSTLEENPTTQYLRTQPPAGDLMCEYRIDGRRYTVRDRGVFKMLGRGWCERFQKRATVTVITG